MVGIKGKSGVYIRKNLLTDEQKRERERVYKKKKWLENPEKYRIRQRLKYQANPEKFRLQAKTWRANNTEKDKENQKRRYWKNPEYYREQAKLRAKRNPEKTKNAWLLRYYGITIDDYKNLLEKQGGVCAICSNKDSKFSLAVDHCHKTGKIRGLLCSRCNFSLGNFNDDIELMNKAIEYLNEHNSN